jgi:hypothetical protein
VGDAACAKPANKTPHAANRSAFKLGIVESSLLAVRRPAFVSCSPNAS